MILWKWFVLTEMISGIIKNWAIGTKKRDWNLVFRSRRFSSEEIQWSCPKVSPFFPQDSSELVRHNGCAWSIALKDTEFASNDNKLASNEIELASDDTELAPNDIEPFVTWLHKSMHLFQSHTKKTMTTNTSHVTVSLSASFYRLSFSIHWH